MANSGAVAWPLARGCALRYAADRTSGHPTCIASLRGWLLRLDGASGDGRGVSLGRGALQYRGGLSGLISEIRRILRSAWVDWRSCLLADSPVHSGSEPRRRAFPGNAEGIRFSALGYAQLASVLRHALNAAVAAHGRLP